MTKQAFKIEFRIFYNQIFCFVMKPEIVFQVECLYCIPGEYSWYYWEVSGTNKGVCFSLSTTICLV